MVARGTKAKRAILGSLIATLVLSANLLVPSPAGAAKRHPSLAAHTTILAKGNGIATVTIPKDVRLKLSYTRDYQDFEGVRFSEGRGLAAVIMRPHGSREADQTLTIARLPQSPDKERTRVVAMRADLCFVNEGGCSLGKGLYDVYVVTQRPVKITFLIAELGGTSTVRATRPITVKISRGEYAYRHGTGTQVEAYGNGFSSDRPGELNLVFHALWFSGPSDPAGPPPLDRPLLQIGRAGGCEYWGAPPPSVAFAPGCPGGQHGGSYGSTKVLASHRFLMWGQRFGPQTEAIYSQGGYVVHTGIVDPGFVGFSLDLTSAP